MAAPGWAALLRARGYRLTPQRQLVLEAVAELGHATPESVVARVRETANGVNISTVYRTLELLEALDLVGHTHLGHGAPTYHLVEHATHVHLVCRACDAVEEAEPAVLGELAERARRGYGFVVDVGHVSLSGLCAACAAALPPADADRY